MTYTALTALLLIFVNLTGSLATPVQLSPATTSKVDYPDPSIESHPWHAFAQFGNKTCSGIIIHPRWIILLETCATEAGFADSKITVHVGGETPEKVEDVVEARVHPIESDDSDGIIVLRLEAALVIGCNVQPARVPLSDWTWRSDGSAAGFSENGTADIRLQTFSAEIDVNCADSEQLCAKGGIDWPAKDAHTRGIDYLEITDVEDGSGFSYQCVVGARKSATENPKVVEYYKMNDIGYWLQKNLGLRRAPFPRDVITCGYLMYDES